MLAILGNVRQVTTAIMWTRKMFPSPISISPILVITDLSIAGAKTAPNNGFEVPGHRREKPVAEDSFISVNWCQVQLYRMEQASIALPIDMPAFVPSILE
jgi:hypothetical protein